MKRRIALQRLGLGLSAGLFLPELMTSCKKDEPGPEVDYDGTVAVIGAGAAGLYAADILRSKGINVIIFEASEFMGGRIRSFKESLKPDESFLLPDAFPDNAIGISVADFPLELGSEIIYGSDSILGTVVKNLNVPVVDMADSIEQYILDNLAKPATDWSSDSVFTAVQTFVNSTLPNYSGAAVSVKAAAGIEERGQLLLNAEAANLYGSSSDQVGAIGLGQALGAAPHDHTRWVLKANQLQDLLLSRFNQVTGKVQYNKQIQSINFSADPVIMTDSNGDQYQANKVIVTVPLSILKTGGISFTPGLPSSMTTSWNNIGMDASVRVLIDFKKNFWGENSNIIWGGAKVPTYFNAGAGRSKYYNTLSITVNGQKAADLSGLGKGMVDTILTELDTIYGVPSPGVTNPATTWVRRQEDNSILFMIKDWSKDKFVKGGFSYPLATTTVDDRKNIGAAIDKKLFFAGEATDVNGDAGTVNGALASAERVVEEVVKSITGS